MPDTTALPAPEGATEPDESELIDAELDTDGGIETTEWFEEPAPNNDGKEGD